MTNQSGKEMYEKTHVKHAIYCKTVDGLIVPSIMVTHCGSMHTEGLVSLERKCHIVLIEKNVLKSLWPIYGQLHIAILLF